ncbi:MAG: DUF1592 domain-containing protein [Candidatus Limnocylindrales bacterium]
MVLAASIGAVHVGCVGAIGDAPPGPTDEGSSPACKTVEPGNSPMRRMIRAEYNNTVHDLLGDTTHPADGFLPEEVSLGFNNQAEALQVTQALAQQYLEAAEALAGDAVANLETLLPCDPASDGDDPCARQFVETFGKRAYRRPLAPSEVDTLLGVYQAGRAVGDFQNGIRLTLEVILQSPHFLYRVEFGMPDPVEADVVALDPYEVAARLSYLIWGSMPDAELSGAADDDKLATREEIAAQARRMLGAPQARAAVATFHRQWLGLGGLDEVDKDPAIYPEYDPSLKALWTQETESFFDHVVFDGDGDLPTLLTAPYSMMNADLAAFYGANVPTSGTWEKVELDPAQRSGFLTQAGLLALNAKTNQSSPVHRGKLVREMLLCQTMPDPPNDIPIVPPDIDPQATTREQFDAHASNPTCASCHVLMDPIGFGFEHYDGIGAWRDQDHGLPVDAHGELTGTVDVDGPFDGVPELAQKLAQSAEVRQCVATQWFRWGHGRKESEADACSLQEIGEAFAAASYDIRELIVALTQTEAFRYRRAVKGEP